jgi:hypothetical protein
MKSLLTFSLFVAASQCVALGQLSSLETPLSGNCAVEKSERSDCGYIGYYLTNRFLTISGLPRNSANKKAAAGLQLTRKEFLGAFIRTLTLAKVSFSMCVCLNVRL